MKRIPTAAALTLFSVALVASAQGAGPTDPQIAAIVVTANQVDIDAGKLAESKSTDKDVQAFAKQMITDHSGVNKAATDLVTQLNVKPEDNPTAQGLKSGGDDHEVTYHQAVIDAMDKTLIPNATNPELKALLVKVRPAFVAHLDHAKHLQM